MNTKVWEKIGATLDRATALSEENERGLKELKETVAKTAEAVDKTVETVNRTSETVNRTSETVNRTSETVNKTSETVDKMAAEREKSLAKLEATVARTAEAVDRAAETVNRTSETVDKMAAEREKSLAKLEATVARTAKSVDDMIGEVKGIGLSNGMVSEEYFYESLNELKTFGGVHYDDVVKNVHGITKLQDGKRLEGQYDIVMYNDTAVCIVEVKYRLRAKDVREVVEKRVDSFKKIFTAYDGYKFYLAVGGMCIEIEDEVFDLARQFGVGVIRSKGGALEFLDKYLKVY